MLNASISEEITLPADQVWAVIGDYDGIRKWAPAVLDERSEQTPEGRVRVLKMPPEGREVRELLTAQSTYSYSYKVLYENDSAPRNFGTVSVVPVSNSASRIELKAEFDAAAGVGEEEALANKNKFLRGNLKAMKRALGLA